MSSTGTSPEVLIYKKVSTFTREEVITRDSPDEVVEFDSSVVPKSTVDGLLNMLGDMDKGVSMYQEFLCQMEFSLVVDWSWGEGALD